MADIGRGQQSPKCAALRCLAAVVAVSGMAVALSQLRPPRMQMALSEWAAEYQVVSVCAVRGGGAGGAGGPLLFVRQYLQQTHAVCERRNVEELV